MKRKYKILIMVFIMFIISVIPLSMLARPNTALNKDTVGIAVKVTPANWKVRKVNNLSQLSSNFKNNREIDLRSKDLSGADIDGKEKELLNSSFDSRTKWPQNIVSISYPRKLCH